MKKIILLVVLALTTQTIKAQADAFITTWVTTTGFETITLAAQPDAPNYDSLLWMRFSAQSIKMVLSQQKP